MSAFAFSLPCVGHQHGATFTSRRASIAPPRSNQVATTKRRAAVVCAANGKAAAKNDARVTSLKEQLFTALRGMDRGLALDADAETLTAAEGDVENAIEDLEDLSATPIPTRDPRVFGHWRLIYTSSSITRYFGGVTGLQRLLPDGAVGRIAQNLDEELGSATITERLFFDVPFRADRVSVDAVVSGKLRATSQTRFVWSPEKVRVAWFSWFAETWKTVRAFQVSDVTYLDEDLRITRGQNGSAFVYERFDPDSTDEDDNDEGY